jgi:RNA polymerase sigma-70 factor (ECF subfamily)
MTLARLGSLDAKASEASRALDDAMNRYADGADDAFGELYDGLAPRLYGFLLRHVRDRSRAEDLLQQCFLQLHRARGQFARGAEVLPWAFAIARRLLIDGHRRGRREVFASDVDPGEMVPEPASTEPAADEWLRAREVARRVELALETVPPSQRAAFELIRLDGLSVAQAARVLGVSETATKLRAHRAYVAIRAAIGDWDTLLAEGGSG